MKKIIQVTLIALLVGATFYTLLIEDTNKYVTEETTTASATEPEKESLTSAEGIYVTELLLRQSDAASMFMDIETLLVDAEDNPNLLHDQEWQNMMNERINTLRDINGFFANKDNNPSERFSELHTELNDVSVDLYNELLIIQGRVNPYDWTLLKESYHTLLNELQTLADVTDNHESMWAK
jgi:hypothetical protein